MAVDRRSELVEAGLRLLGGLRFEDVLNAVETKAIAEAAGVTTGSFFHHFRSRVHYAQAVLDRWEELWATRADRLRAHASRAADERGPQGVRGAAGYEWEALTAWGGVEVVQHLLWAIRDQPLVDDSPRTGADLLGAAYAELGAVVRADYERGMRGIGREPMPPFTQAELEVMTTAMAEGLQLRAGVDPSAVRPGLYGDAVAAILLGATRPRRTRGDEGPDDDLARLERRLGGGARPASGESGASGASVRWREIADAAAHLFVDRSPHQVRLTEVAAAAGLGPDLVAHEFDSVAAVAAAGWVRHVPTLEALASAPLDGGDPLRRIEAVLLRYVELARENRGAAEALVGQIIAQTAPSAEPARHDLRILVPVPALLEPHIQELRGAGRLRRRIEITRLARSLVHLVTMQALLFPDETPERVIDETMTMVFDGALVEPSDG